jgi:hypothetical protein
MLSERSYLAQALGIGCSLVALALLANVMIDPYDVFGLRLLPKYGELQERLHKVEFLKTHPDFDTFLLGSSRVGTIAVEDVEAVQANSKVYNLSLANSNLWDQLEHFRWLLRTQPKLKTVFVQVDYPETFGPEHAGYELLTRLHPDLSGESWLSFYKSYLVALSYNAIKRKLANNFGSVSQVDYSIGKGYWDRPAREQALRKNCAAYAAGEYTFHEQQKRPPSSSRERDVIDASIGALRTLQQLAAEHQVAVHLYVTPHHAKWLDRINVDDYLYFLDKLAEVGSFWNFGFYSDLTSNNCNYHESSHFRRQLGAFLFKSMQQAPLQTTRVAHWVTPASISAELAFTRANFESHAHALEQLTTTQ